MPGWVSRPQSAKPEPLAMPALASRAILHMRKHLQHRRKLAASFFDRGYE
jgi:hypothetical protein